MSQQIKCLDCSNEFEINYEGLQGINDIVIIIEIIILLF